MLANAVGQSKLLQLTHRIREQARSHILDRRNSLDSYDIPRYKTNRLFTSRSV